MSSIPSVGSSSSSTWQNIELDELPPARPSSSSGGVELARAPGLATASNAPATQQSRAPAPTRTTGESSRAGMLGPKAELREPDIEAQPEPRAEPAPPSDLHIAAREGRKAAGAIAGVVGGLGLATGGVVAIKEVGWDLQFNPVRAEDTADKLLTTVVNPVVDQLGVLAVGGGLYIAAKSAKTAATSSMAAARALVRHFRPGPAAGDASAATGDNREP